MHGDLIHDYDNHNETDAEVEGESGPRSASTHKRRKRGARKGKGSVSTAMSPTTPSAAHDVTLETLAQASQALAREISRTSRQPVPMSPAPDVPPLQYPISPGMALPPLSLVNASVPAPLPSPNPDTPTIVKKSSKWKLSFGKTTSSSGTSKASPAVEDVPPLPEPANVGGKQMSATASNVTNLLMGLNAPATPPPRTALRMRLIKSCTIATPSTIWRSGPVVAVPRTLPTPPAPTTVRRGVRPPDRLSALRSCVAVPSGATGDLTSPAPLATSVPSVVSPRRAHAAGAL